MNSRISWLCILALVGTAAAASARPLENGIQTKGEFTPPCEGEVWWADTDATFDDFDFWLGEWQVYDRNDGTLLGFDTIERELEGCTIRQHWRQMNDRFALPGAPFRYQGASVSGIGASGNWRQTWVDNSAGFMVLEGGLDEDGVMTLESEWLIFDDPQGQRVALQYRWHWAPTADGSISNWGFFRQRAGLSEQDGGWIQYFDIIYSRSQPGGSTFELVQ